MRAQTWGRKKGALMMLWWCRKIRHQVKRGVFSGKKAWFEVLLLLPTPPSFSRLSALPFAVKVLFPLSFPPPTPQLTFNHTAGLLRPFNNYSLPPRVDLGLSATTSLRHSARSLCVLSFSAIHIFVLTFLLESFATRYPRRERGRRGGRPAGRDAPHRRAQRA